MEKVCRICGEQKTLEHFVKRGKDSYRNECKPCVNLKKRKTPIKPTPKDNHKFCAKCKEEKPLDSFALRFSSVLRRHTHFSYCRECERKRDSERYAHKCVMCGKEYRSGRKDNTKCKECHIELMRQDKVMYKNKKRDFNGEKNPMYGKQRFGEENPNYKHGLSESERYKKRLIEGYGIWRKRVYERDHYTCQCCFKSSEGDIVAHHLDAYSWCEEKRVDVTNGVTLCTKCHEKFHKIYGKSKNTKEQFMQFKDNLEYLE